VHAYVLARATDTLGATPDACKLLNTVTSVQIVAGVTHVNGVLSTRRSASLSVLPGPWLRSGDDGDDRSVCAATGDATANVPARARSTDTEGFFLRILNADVRWDTCPSFN